MQQGPFLRKQTVDLFLTVVEIVAPVFILASIGYAWIKLGFEYKIQFVTRIAMGVSIPALIFISLMKTDINPELLSVVSLAALTTYAAVALAALILIRLARLEIRTYLAALTFGNTGNLGLPIAYFAYGQEGLGYAVVIFAIMAILSFTFGIWLVSGGGSLVKVVKEPIVIATLLGALFLWQGWQTPQWATNTLELVGQMAIPLMLITLGVAMARLKPAKFLRASWLSVVRVIGCVGLAWVVGRWFNLAPVAFGALVLQISTPVAVTFYLLAEKYDADSDSVAGLVVTSTLLSIGTIPLTLMFLL